MTVRGYEEHKVQHGEKKFKCSECDKGFGTKRALAQHFRELCSEGAKQKKTIVSIVLQVLLSWRDI